MGVHAVWGGFYGQIDSFAIFPSSPVKWHLLVHQEASQRSRREGCKPLILIDGSKMFAGLSACFRHCTLSFPLSGQKSRKCALFLYFEDFSSAIRRSISHSLTRKPHDVQRREPSHISRRDRDKDDVRKKLHCQQ